MINNQNNNNINENENENNMINLQNIEDEELPHFGGTTIVN
jgi:hypothetical protein